MFYDAPTTIDMPNRIDSERLYLQRIGPEAAPTVYHVVESERERLAPQLPHMNTIVSLEEEVAYLVKMEKRWEEKSAFCFGIFAHEYDFFLGHIAAFDIDWGHLHCEIGYWIREKAEGKGYMTEALVALERQLFAIGLHRLELRVAIDNNRSERIPRRCGYLLDGRLRECLKTGPGYQDLLVFSKLNES
jgi:ribosomal-protein-serine acetyltransferase